MKITEIACKMVANPKKGIKYQPAQKFTTLFGDRVFTIIQKSKTQIDIQDIKTKEIFHVTPNDTTNYFPVND